MPTPNQKQESNLVVQRPSEIKPDFTPSLLYWGPAKSGKTHFALTAGDRSLFISNGMGSATIQNQQFKSLNNFIINVPFDDFDNPIRSFDLVDNAVEIGLTDLKDQIDTIIVDDASAQTRSGYIKALEFNDSMGKSQTLDKIRKSKMNELILFPGDYGTEMDMTMQFWAHVISECKRAGKNFILLAHERIVYSPPPKMGEQPSIIKKIPAFTGADKNPDRIAGLFDWVMHTRTVVSGDKIIYQAETKGDSSLMAGCRGKAQEIFPKLITNPNFLAMLNQVRAV